MTDIKVIQAAIEQIAPPHLAEEWDNSGFQIRCDEAQKIRKILVCLEISDEVVAEAVADKADLIITHHPLIFGKISKVDHKNIMGNQIIRLIQAGISVYSAHTSFDSARRGTNQYLAEQIGLEEIMPLVPASEEGCGMGRIGIYSSPVKIRLRRKYLSCCRRAAGKNSKGFHVYRSRCGIYSNSERKWFRCLHYWRCEVS